MPACRKTAWEKGWFGRPRYHDAAVQLSALTVSTRPANDGDRPRSRVSINGRNTSAPNPEAATSPRSATTDGSPRAERERPGRQQPRREHDHPGQTDHEQHDL